MPVAVGALVLFLLGTPAGNDLLVGAVLPRVQPPAGTLAVERVRLGLSGGVWIEGVSIRDRDGHELVGLDRLAAQVRLGALVGRRVVVDRAEVEGLRVSLVDGERCLDPAAPWDDGAPSPEGAPWSGLGVDIDVRSLRLGATRIRTCGDVDVAPLDLAGTVTLRGPLVTARLTGTGHAAGPAAGALGLDLGAAWNGERVLVERLVLDLGPNHANVKGLLRDLGGEGVLALEVSPLSILPESLGIADVAGPLVASGKISGTFQAPSATLQVATPGGAAGVVASIDLRGEVPTWAAVVDTDGVDVHRVVPSVPPTTFAGHVDAQGAGLTWPAQLDATVNVDARLAQAGGQPGPFVVRGAAVLHAGEVQTDGLAVQTPAGSLVLSGRVDVVGGTSSLGVERLTVDLARLAAYGAPGLTGTVQYRGRVEGGWPEPWVSFDGTIVGAGLGYGETVDVGGAEGALRGGWRAGAVSLGGSLRLEGVKAAAAELGAAQVELDVAGVLPRGLGGTVVVHGGPLAYAPYHADDLVVSVALGGGGADLVADLRAGERLVAGVTGRLLLDTLALDLSRLVLAPGGVTWTNRGPVRATLDGGVRELSLALEGAGLVALSGEVGDALDLTGRFEAVDLAALLDLYPGLLPGVLGQVDGTVQVQGPLADLAVDADLTCRSLTVPDVVRATRVGVELHPAKGGVSVLASLVGPKGELLVVEGDLPLRVGTTPGVDPDGPVALTAVLRPTDNKELEAVFPALDLPTFRASAALRLGGTGGRPEVGLTTSVSAPPGPGEPWLFVDLDLETRDGVADARAVLRERLARRAELGGTFDLALDRLADLWLGRPQRWDAATDLVGNLSLDLVPLQLPVEAFLGETGISGSLLGGLHVSGDELSPEVEGAIMLVDGMVGQAAVSSALLTVTPRPGVGYTVELQAGFGPGETVRVNGLVPWATRLDGDLDQALAREGLLLQVQGDAPGTEGKMPLRALEGLAPGLSEATGHLLLSGAVTGSLSAPQPRLALSVPGASFVLEDTGVRYEQVVLDAKVTPTTVEVTQLSMETTPRTGAALDLGMEFTREDVPDVRARARIEIEDYAPTRIAGQVDLARAWILALPTREVRTSGQLTLGGTWPKLEAAGAVEVDDAYIKLDEGFFSQLDELALDPEVHVQRPGSGAVAAAAEEGLPLPRLDVSVALHSAVDVDVTMPVEQVLGEVGAMFSNVRVQATLDGELQLVPEDELALGGAVEVKRGSAVILGEKFDIAEGLVAFTGRGVTDPVVYLTATRNTGEWGTIRAEIGGTPSAPEITFSGEGGLTADDVISVIVFGAPLSAIDGGSAVALANRIMTSLAGGLDQARQAAPLDVVELAPTGASRVGKRIGRNVLVVLVLDPLAAEGESPLVVSVELQLPQRWSLVADYGTVGEVAVRAVRKWRF